MKTIHLIAGLLALLAGATALMASKGSPLHRKSGQLFVAGMLVLTISAALLALVLQSHPNPLVNMVNGTAALLTFYLVGTAWLTVKYPVEQTRGVIAGFALLALAVGTNAVWLAVQAMADSGGGSPRMPAQPLLLFAIVASLGVVLDIRLLWLGRITGGQRTVRHLWRMGFAMWIATASFFLGQAKLFPEPIRKPALLALPVLWVTVTLVYWLVRMLIKRTHAPPADSTQENP